MKRDYARLVADLSSMYTAARPRSAAVARRALATMVDGGSQGVRLTRPFPPRISDARGAYVTDADGHRLLDLWQGHFANILGHAPPVVTEALAEAFAAGSGLQLGIPDEQTIATAELLCSRVHAESIRFTTSGTLATMYAVMLARAFTGRQRVLKVAGGWHGAQPWGLKGVHFHPGDETWTLESEGLPARISDEVVITRFNDPEDLAAQFRRYGEKAACLLVEPMAGLGNFMFATPEYLAAARELTRRHGALLIFDEVITAFRFCAGDLGALYGVRPDLIVLGKLIGGGMPVAAVAGRRDVLDLCGRECGYRVRFSGGTYSAHPASMLAAQTLISYLVEHEGFPAGGVLARCSGAPNEVVAGGSLTGLHFPYDAATPVDRPDLSRDPALFDVVLKDQVLQLALLLEGVYTLDSCCALSTAHDENDIERVGAACRAVADMVRPYL